MDNVVVTDLGIIKVESKGNRDVIILAHNNLRACTVTCYPKRQARIAFTEEFLQYPDVPLREVFVTYVHWKRQADAAFKLKNHSGQTKDGHTHPWRNRVNPKQI